MPTKVVLPLRVTTALSWKKAAICRKPSFKAMLDCTSSYRQSAATYPLTTSPLTNTTRLQPSQTNTPPLFNTTIQRKKAKTSLTAQWLQVSIRRATFLALSFKRQVKRKVRTLANPTGRNLERPHWQLEVKWVHLAIYLTSLTWTCDQQLEAVLQLRLWTSKHGGRSYLDTSCRDWERSDAICTPGNAILTQLERQT